MTVAKLVKFGAKQKWSAWHSDEKSLREIESRESKKKIGDWAMRLVFVLNECGSTRERNMVIRKAKALLETLSDEKSKSG